MVLFTGDMPTACHWISVRPLLLSAAPSPPLLRVLTRPPRPAPMNRTERTADVAPPSSPPLGLQMRRGEENMRWIEEGEA
jgi:hypothetical protein